MKPVLYKAFYGGNSYEFLEIPNYTRQNEIVRDPSRSDPRINVYNENPNL